MLITKHQFLHVAAALRRGVRPTVGTLSVGSAGIPDCTLCDGMCTSGTGRMCTRVLITEHQFLHVPAAVRLGVRPTVGTLSVGSAGTPDCTLRDRMCTIPLPFGK